MSLSPIEFISDQATGQEGYERWLVGIEQYCELTYDLCMEDCKAGAIVNDDDPRWTAATCKCVYDRTDKQEQHVLYLLLGCAIMVRSHARQLPHPPFLRSREHCAEFQLALDMRLARSCYVSASALLLLALLWVVQHAP